MDHLHVPACKETANVDFAGKVIVAQITFFL
jgi:hypothetical protein